MPVATKCFERGGKGVLARRALAAMKVHPRKAGRVHIRPVEEPLIVDGARQSSNLVRRLLPLLVHERSVPVGEVSSGAEGSGGGDGTGTGRAGDEGEEGEKEVETHGVRCRAEAAEAEVEEAEAVVVEAVVSRGLLKQFFKSTSHR